MNKFWKILGTFGPAVLTIVGLVVDAAASKVQEEETRAICREEIAAYNDEQEDA